MNNSVFWKSPTCSSREKSLLGPSPMLKFNGSENVRFASDHGKYSLPCWMGSGFGSGLLWFGSVYLWRRRWAGGQRVPRTWWRRYWQQRQSVTPAANEVRLRLCLRLHLTCAIWKIGNEIGNTFTTLRTGSVAFDWRRLTHTRNSQASHSARQVSPSPQRPPTVLIGDIAQITQMLSITWRRQANTKTARERAKNERLFKH